MRRTSSSFEIDATLRRIAAGQLGLITVEQAARGGVDKFALDRRRAAGALVPVFAEVMRLGTVAQSAPQRILAASLALPGSQIAATAAAVIHAMPTPSRFSGLDDPPTMSVGLTRSARTKGIVTIRQVSAMPSQRWMTTRLATPAAALVLLPRFLDDRSVERCLDHSLAHRLTTVATVRALIERVPTRAVHGRRFLIDLLDQRLSGIGHRSGLEQKVAGWLNDSGLGDWQRNFKVLVSGEATVEATVEVDFGWPSGKVALEVSPFFTHGSRATQERDARRRRLLVECGWRIVEATDPDVESQRAFARTVAALKSLLSAA